MTFEDRAGIIISQLRADRDRLQTILDEIREIVDEWQLDTWTDNISNDCMVKIVELIESYESEE